MFKFFFKIFLLAHSLHRLARDFILGMLTALSGESIFLLGTLTAQSECIFFLGTLTTLSEEPFFDTLTLREEFLFFVSTHSLHQMKIFLLGTFTALCGESFSSWHAHCTV